MADLRAPLLQQADAVEQLRGFAPDRVEGPEQLQDLLQRQVVEVRCRLQLHPDPPLQLHPVRNRVKAQHLSVTGGRLADPFDDLERRRLPRPVRPEEPEQLAVTDLERHAVDRIEAATPRQRIGLDEVCDLDRGLPAVGGRWKRRCRSVYIVNHVQNLPHLRCILLR
jgi:hypothetical protein